MSPKAHSSNLHGRVTDGAEVFAGTRKQLLLCAVDKKRKTEYFFFIVHACLVSIAVMYLGACFSRINIYSKIFDLATMLSSLPVHLAVTENNHSSNTATNVCHILS